MNEDQRNALIAVWAALDATGGDTGTVQDEIDQAINTWSPQ